MPRSPLAASAAPSSSEAEQQAKPVYDCFDVATQVGRRRSSSSTDCAPPAPCWHMPPVPPSLNAVHTHSAPCSPWP